MTTIDKQARKDTKAAEKAARQNEKAWRKWYKTDEGRAYLAWNEGAPVYQMNLDGGVPKQGLLTGSVGGMGLNAHYKHGGKRDQNEATVNYVLSLGWQLQNMTPVHNTQIVRRGYALGRTELHYVFVRPPVLSS